MNKEKILGDFLVFFLSEYEELLSDIISFFYQKEDSIIVDYETFIQRQFTHLDFHPSEFTDEPKSITSENIISLEDIVPKSKISSLLNFLYENFHHGFPDGDGGGGRENLEVSEIDLENYFRTYINYLNINPEVYISVYKQLFQTRLHDVIKCFNENVEEEKRKLSKLDNFDDKIQSEFESIIYDKLMSKTIENVQKKPFQYYGHSDEFGIYLNEITTINNWLKLAQKDQMFVVNSFNASKFTGIDYLVYKEVRYPDQLQRIGNNSFTAIKKDEKEYIEYLKRKSYHENEIDIILNLLSKNNIDTTIRKMEITGL